VKNRVPIRLPEGVDPVRDILYVDDFSRACRTFINSKVQFGLYNLGGGRLNTISIRDLLKRIGAAIDIEPVIQDDPAMPAPVPLRYVSDTQRIENELGWRLQIGIDPGISAIL
jgi:nucleoside-diphosphate-sugar epimerase